MAITLKQIEALVQQIRQGDSGAAQRLRRELTPYLIILVSRALTTRSTALPLTRWIRAQAGQVRVAAGRSPAEARAWLVAVLVQQTGDWIVNQLGAGAGSTRLLRETLCA
jgi:hypothetical protein